MLGLSPLAARAIALALAIGALLAAVAAIHHRGEQAGAAKVTAVVEQQHAAAVVEARTDERAATAAAAAIGARNTAAADAAIAALQATETEVRHAFDDIPARADDGGVPAAPVGVLAPSINALVDRANRAADAAGAPG